MSSKTNIALLFANYNIKNKSIYYTGRLSIAVSKVLEILWYLLHEGNFCILTSLIALLMRSEGNAPKNGEQTVGMYTTTMLQRTGRFW